MYRSKNIQEQTKKLPKIYNNPSASAKVELVN